VHSEPFLDLSSALLSPPPPLPALLQIPVLQTMGALYMGNRPTLKVDSKVSVVMEQFIRLLHAVGLPKVRHGARRSWAGVTEADCCPRSGCLRCRNGTTVHSPAAFLLLCTSSPPVPAALPQSDIDFINCDGPTMHKFLKKAQPSNTLFTGSSR
jgi:hypothetical protein